MVNFLGIGAQKSGTTWLYETLLKHPKISFPGGKEVHFWNKKTTMNMDQYTQVFSDNNRINGDITPAYGILPISTIQKVYDVLPHVRMVYLMRNPMDRAWSSARMALGRAELASDEGSDQWFIDHFLSRGSLARGDYETCIRNWRSIFPSDQLLVLRYEDIINDPVTLANRILVHIGLEPFFNTGDDYKLREKVFSGDGVKIRSSLLPVLKNIYSEKIKSLENYLHDDFSAWQCASNTSAVSQDQ